MTIEEIKAVWDIENVSDNLMKAFDHNSELELLQIIKNNSFLLYELYSRKNGIQPPFCEITFGSNMRCDFAWLNDNSDGPEWVLLEVEKPKLELFRKDNNEPTHQFNHAIEQIKSWRRYFNENPTEKRRIFGSVARFRYILVGGKIENWSTEQASKWRIDNNKETEIEIRSSEIFLRALKVLKEHPNDLWSFAEHPKSLAPSELADFWGSYRYMDIWRKIIN
jgi:hypothetical protein